MKKVIFLAVAALTLTIFSSATQMKAQSDDEENQPPMIKWTFNADVPDFMTVFGKVSPDGTTFVGDRDHKSWTIANPKMLKECTGQHVSLLVTEDIFKDRMVVKYVRSIDFAAKPATS